jgi:hypothetical protein
MQFERRLVGLYSSYKNRPRGRYKPVHFIMQRFLKRQQTKKKKSEKKERVTDGEGKEKRSARA